MYVFLCRHDQCWGASSSGTWLSHAMSTQLPASPIWDHAWVLAQGRNGETYIWNSAVETWGVLHSPRERVQRGLNPSPVLIWVVLLVVISDSELSLALPPLLLIPVGLQLDQSSLYFRIQSCIKAVLASSLHLSTHWTPFVQKYYHLLTVDLSVLLLCCSVFGLPLFRLWAEMTSPHSCICVTIYPRNFQFSVSYILLCC